jgi:hypothetical protein
MAGAAADMEVTDAAGKDRLAALSDAFGMGKGKIGQMAAASAADAFSESTLALARAQPEFVREIGAANTFPFRACLDSFRLRWCSSGYDRKRPGQFRVITVHSGRVAVISCCFVIDASARTASDAPMAARDGP